MAKVISFINMKGGVGKTTLTVNLGYSLSYNHGKKILIVDCDPQFNASTYLMSEDDYLQYSQDQNKHTIRDIFLPPETKVRTVHGKDVNKKSKSITLKSCTFRVFPDKSAYLDLIPSTLNLMVAETSQRGTENRLHRFLNDKQSAYDFILIDCPPTISIFSQAAILASDSYIVPVKPDPLSAVGLPLLETWMENYIYSVGKSISLLGVIFCMVRSPLPNQMARVMTELRSERPLQVFEKSLTQATKIAESVEAHKPIFLYAPGSKGAREISLLADEFLTRVMENTNG